MVCADNTPNCWHLIHIGTDLLVRDARHGRFDSCMQSVLSHLPTKAVHVIPDLLLDKADGVLHYLIEIRTVCGDPDPAAWIQYLQPVSGQNVHIRNLGLYLDVVHDQEGHLPCMLLEPPDGKHYIVTSLLISGCCCFPACLGLQEMNMQQQDRQQMLMRAIHNTQEQNPGLKLMADGSLKLVDVDGKHKTLSWNDDKHKVMVKLDCGRAAQHQHYDRCTLKALRLQKDLLCPFHFGNTTEWYTARRREIPQAEIRWMQVAKKTMGGEDWCHQVRAPFHKGDFDFWNWRRDAYLQIDEARHWEGMTAASHTRQSERDFTCNLAAYKASAAVVRVHTADITHPACIYAAMEAAIYQHTVVLSASYSTVIWTVNNNQLSYADRLQHHFGDGCTTYVDPYGNIAFLRGDAPTM